MKTKILILVVALGMLVAFTPVEQTVTRFVSIYVRGNADIVGNLDVDGTANLDNVDIDGTVDLASTLDLGGDLDMQNNIISNIGAAGTDFGTDGSFTAAQTVTISAGTLVVSAGGASVGGDITLENGETVGNSTDDIISLSGGLLPSGTTITATDGLTITPTLYNVYNLDSSEEVTVTLAACTEFQWVELVGDDANTINVADTNIRTTDGNALTIGQYDILGFRCIDAEWILQFESDNS